MPSRIPPLREADLPSREVSLWKLIGPGAILVGLSIGSAEIIMWPWVTAQFGASMLWAAALGVFLQIFVNLEIGRWAIATGDTTYTAYARLSMAVIHAMLGIGFIMTCLPGWARISGVALKALLLGPDHASADWLWTTVTFVGVLLVLFGPKVMYAALERTVVAMVVFIIAGLLVVVYEVGNTEYLTEIGRGLVNVGHIETSDNFSFYRFFAAMVFAGSGGSGNLWYAFYLRDKNVGMGARIPRLTNRFRSREETDTPVGYIYPETPENQRRFRDWFRYLAIDQVVIFFGLNMFTILLFAYAAMSVLYAQGIVPAEGRILWDEAVILQQSMGTAGRYLFLVIGMAALFSTQLAVVDGTARAWAYILTTCFKAPRRFTQNEWYPPIAVAACVIGIAGTILLETTGVSGLMFVFLTAMLGGFIMAIYVPLTLYANLKFLPRSARPGWFPIAMSTLASLVYIGFSLFTIYTLVRPLLE